MVKPDTQKVLIIIGIAGLLVAILTPFLSAFIGGSGIELPSTGKRITCDTTVLNPVFNDNYRFEFAECESKASFICELPLSISGLSIFREPDTVKVQIQSEGQLAKSKTVELEEGITGGTRKNVELTYCVPKNQDLITLSIINERNEVTDSRGVNV